MAVTDQGSRAVDGGPPTRRWAWTAVLFGAWIVGGVLLVIRALARGDINDVGVSPYHVMVYSGLFALALVSVWLVARAWRGGSGWRTAFPLGLGALGAGALVLLGTVVADVAWREGVGIGQGIEGTLAPSRVLLLIGLTLVAMAPLRAALSTGDPRLRWPAVVSSGLLVAVFSVGGSFHPAVNPWLERAPDSPGTNSEIWIMDADGARQTRLLETVEHVSLVSPAWSPDGTRIAYTRLQGTDDVRSEDADIWVANADGSDPRPLVTGPGWQWFPRWSPDGAWVAYTQEATGGPSLPSGPTGPRSGQGVLGPDFSSTGATAIPEADLWRVRSDGGGAPVRITNTEGDDRSGSWSPDGLRLAFDSTRDGNTEIYAVNVDGINPVRLTDDPAKDMAAAWSPDGTRIAFTSFRSGLTQIWVMAADGTAAAELTNDAGGNQGQAWSTDGTRIVFTSWRSGSGQVRSMAADGTDVRDLSRSPSTSDGVWDGSWGPDGRIVFTRTAPALASAQPIAREDLGVASMLISALVLALIVGLLVRTGPPFGAVAAVMGIETALAASEFDMWRFVPAAIVAGLLVDLAIRLAPVRRRPAIGASGAAGGQVLAAGVTAILTTGLGWSPTLWLGVALAAAIGGWAIGAIVAGLAMGSPPGERPAPPETPAHPAGA